ncbi:hypothetical protein Dip510_000038 [Elusimicrobium posterum]|uniref:hypothetical protein n=1 Tax=Elusimicrobium posterum TaxID=3116653 RepID=UPI003C77A74A
MAENKESFTFSDKLKDSKPAAVPLSKRFSSSRVGADGKPKKTFFERTKRDAPFFIAALVILLLLPFFVKFAGPEVDPGTILTKPTTIFPPTSLGYEDLCLDDNGNRIDDCVAPLADNSSFGILANLLKGDEVPEYDDRDAYGGYTPPATIDDGRTFEERVITPIRESAPATALAGVQRTPTQIGRLNSGEMATARGRVSHGWSPMGASAAAVGAPGPRQSAKPISLTPLEAASILGRTPTGEAALAEAQRSMGSMSKRDAMRALMDAQVSPTEVGRIGSGLGGGSLGVGGGSGAPGNKFGFSPGKPWWWDFEEYKRKEKWTYWWKFWTEPLAKLFAKVFENLGCCIVMGEKDCKAKHFLGKRPEGAAEASCMGVTESKWKEGPHYQNGKNSFPATELGCCGLWADNKAGMDCNKPNKDMEDEYKWVEGKGTSPGLGFFEVRKECLGGVVSSGAGIDLTCSKTTIIDSDVTTSGRATGWNHYTYVVARNVPTSTGRYLCGYRSDARHMPKGASAGLGGGASYDTNLTEYSGNLTVVGQQTVTVSRDQYIPTTDNKAVQAVGEQNTLRPAGTSVTQNDLARNTAARDYDKETYIYPDDCVIYISKNDRVTESEIRAGIMTVMSSKDTFGCSPDEYDKATNNYVPAKINSCRNMLPEIHITYMGAVATSKPLAGGGGSFYTDDIYARKGDPTVRDIKKGKIAPDIPQLPMTWRDFDTTYLKQVGNSADASDNGGSTRTSEKQRQKAGQRKETIAETSTSALCKINRKLTFYGPTEFCKDNKTNKYYPFINGKKGAEPYDPLKAGLKPADVEGLRECPTTYDFTVGTTEVYGPGTNISEKSGETKTDTKNGNGKSSIDLLEGKDISSVSVDADGKKTYNLSNKAATPAAETKTADTTKPAFRAAIYPDMPVDKIQAEFSSSVNPKDISGCCFDKNRKKIRFSIFRNGNPIKSKYLPPTKDPLFVYNDNLTIKDICGFDAGTLERSFKCPDTDNAMDFCRINHGTVLKTYYEGGFKKSESLSKDEYIALGKDFGALKDCDNIDSNYVLWSINHEAPLDNIIRRVKKNTAAMTPAKSYIFSIEGEQALDHGTCCYDKSNGKDVLRFSLTDINGAAKISMYKLVDDEDATKACGYVKETDGSYSNAFAPCPSTTVTENTPPTGGGPIDGGQKFAEWFLLGKYQESTMTTPAKEHVNRCANGIAQKITTLKNANPNLEFHLDINGFTDAKRRGDSDAGGNLDLSKKRAATIRGMFERVSTIQTLVSGGLKVTDNGYGIHPVCRGEKGGPNASDRAAKSYEASGDTQTLKNNVIFNKDESSYLVDQYKTTYVYQDGTTRGITYASQDAAKKALGQDGLYPVKACRTVEARLLHRDTTVQGAAWNTEFVEECQHQHYQHN